LVRIRTKNSRKYPIDTTVSDPQVVQVGGRGISLPGYVHGLGFGSTLHPYKIVARLKDGRRFELKVNALNRQEAIAQVNNKFPLATIQKVSRADKIRTVERFLDTAERYFES